MAGIAGIAAPGRRTDVERMLDKLAHRGNAIRDIVEAEGATLGATAPAGQATAICPHGAVRDYPSRGHYAQAQLVFGRLVLLRDPLGVAPLYHGKTADGSLCFASEVKALLLVSDTVAETPPGSFYGGRTASPHFHLDGTPALNETPEQIARALARRLTDAVQECIQPDRFGAWLSGGLDSSALVALARQQTNELHTFAGGLKDAPDLEYARAVAEFSRTKHHESIVTLDDMLRLLPTVIYHLESFDALLVRSSIINFTVARAAASYVPAVLSGEGGDELFAGFEYLKSMPRTHLVAELQDITGRLHNTALQRMDRCASAHGIVAHTCFLDPPVVDLALKIPIDMKLRAGDEKWILRHAMKGLLPERVLARTKAKFWEGAGVGCLLSDHAENTVSNSDFSRERLLPNGWILNTKEELMYYRIFREHFERCSDLEWMGRTKGAPSART